MNALDPAPGIAAQLTLLGRLVVISAASTSQRLVPSQPRSPCNDAAAFTPPQFLDCLANCGEPKLALPARPLRVNLYIAGSHVDI
jgi:hypothetical protein